MTTYGILARAYNAAAAAYGAKRTRANFARLAAAHAAITAWEKEIGLD